MLTSLVLLALTITVIGSMGIASASSVDSLKYQLESGVAINDIICRDNLVLVLRTSDSFACVTESTSEKLGWNIIESNISQITYEFPISSKTFIDPSFTTEPKGWWGETILTISNLPKIGETAEVTATFTNLRDNDTIPEFIKLISVSDNFEVIETSLPILDFGTDGSSVRGSLMILGTNQTDSITITIKAVKEGKGELYSRALESEAHFYLMVGKSETILYEDWKQNNPQLYSQQQLEFGVQINDCPQSPKGEEPVPCVAPTPHPIDEVEPAKSAYMADEDISLEVSNQEFIKWLEEESGYSDEKIKEYKEDLKKKLTHDTISDITSYAGSFITLYGKVTNDLSQYSKSYDRNVFDVQVCAWDYDSKDRTYDNIGCTNTDERGSYTFGNVRNLDEDGTGLDLLYTISTNGKYSSTKDINKKFYTFQSLITWNIPDASKRFDYKPYSTGSIDQQKLHKAFWITDSIADGREYFKDNGIYLDQVDVYWQYDKGSKIFSGKNSNGAGYSTTSKIIYLDGFDKFNLITDDSPQRWTILHEYGHHVMNEEFRGWPNGCTEGHDVHLENTIGCAWKEGWADIVPSFVDNTEDYQVSRFLEYDFEKGFKKSYNKITYFKITSSVDEIGHKVEGEVASTLWDIKDRKGTASYDKRDGINKDNQSLGVNEILKVFSKEDRTFEGFYKQWNKDYSRYNIDDIMYLHYMGFLNSSPVISSISNTSVNEKSTLQFTVRANDPDGDNLTFSLIQSPTGATISNSGSFRWTPIESQIGTHTITVKVSDGKLSDTDSFRVIVLDVTDPEIKITSPTTGTHYYTNNDRVTISGTSSDNVGIKSISFELNGVGIGGVMPSNFDNWSFTFTVSRSSNTLHVVAEDLARNTSIDELFIIYSDPSHKSPPRTVKPTSNSITSNSVTINWIAPDSIPIISEYDIFRSASPKVLIATVPSTQLSYTDDTVLSSTTYQYTISATNQYGNGEESEPLEVITLEDVDVTPPVIVLIGNSTQTIELGDTYMELGATASDDIDGDITSNIVIDNSSLDVTTIGSYSITYDVIDSSNNPATQLIRTVNVITPEFPKYISYRADIDLGFGLDDDDKLLYTIDNGDTWNEPYYIMSPYSKNSDLVILEINTPLHDNGHIIWLQAYNLEPHIAYALFEITNPNECRSPTPGCHYSEYGVIVSKTGNVITTGHQTIFYGVDVPFDYPPQ